MYAQLLKDYYGDAVDMNAFTGITWSRIPHFFNSPYYVYQYATCFASAAKFAKQIWPAAAIGRRPRSLPRPAALRRQRLSDGAAAQGGRRPRQPDTVLAVVDQLDDLVTRLEQELEKTS